jgi:hypothetical protein
VADKRRRRDEARRARIEQERRASRARKNRIAAIAAGGAIVALIVALIVTLAGSGGSFTVQYVSTPSIDPTTLGRLLTTPPPWPTNTGELSQRLAAENLPSLNAMEGQVLHIHQHIDLYIRGQHLAVPAQIGIVTSPQVLFAPIHTHDGSGIIHIESPTQRDFSLGEFFDVWGVLFTPMCIGAYCNSGSERLQVFANGKVVTGNPRQLKLLEHEEIVVTFGTPAQIPRPYPVSYRFAPTL